MTAAAQMMMMMMMEAVLTEALRMAALTKMQVKCGLVVVAVHVVE